jgi:hypothetical protein
MIRKNKKHKYMKKLKKKLRGGEKEAKAPPEPVTGYPVPVPVTGYPVPEPAPAAEKGDNKTAGGSLMKAFNSIHNIFAAIGIILLTIIFVLITIDVFSLIFRDISQYIILFINPNMYNKDTLDFNTLMYYKNSKDDEPYNIYQQQSLISNIFKLGYYYIIFTSMQIIVYISLYLYFKFKGIEYKEELSLKNIQSAVATMIIVIASAFILNSYYNNAFIKSLQPKLMVSKKNMIDIKNDIYNNMIENDTFLKALLNNNMRKVLEMINDEDSLNNVSKMIFTVSLYNYFKINISENKEEFSIVKEIFTVSQINIRRINPVDYMYYSQNNFVQNLYPIMKDYIVGKNKVLDTEQKEYRVRTDISNRINNLNNKMISVFKVPSKKQSFKNYIYISWIIVVSLLACISIIYINQIKETVRNTYLIIYETYNK